MFKKIKRIHFVGIGGSGMSGIAEVLITLGYQVSGSDMKETDVTQRLASLGARILIGHQAAHSVGADVVVTSTAVAVDNPEVVQARTAGIPVIPRIEMLAELARLKYTIAVAGTHGKTTTTSMVGSVLHAGGLDPTIIVGGRLKHLNSGARLGKGDFLVAEADESDGSFLKLSPTLGIITNIDNDHLDYYGTFDRIAEAFVQFSSRVPFYGCMVVCIENPAIRQQIPHMTRRLVTYGLRDEADLQAREIQQHDGFSRFQVFRKGVLLGEVQLRIPGQHNVLNALAAIAIGLELEIPWAQIVKGLFDFEGVGRRLELKGDAKNILVYDDYGHHPTEIEATLSALKDRYPKRRLVVLFQPHRFSRTQALWKEFAHSFAQADQVYVLDIYPAGEKPIAGVSASLITEELIKRQPSSRHFSFQDANALRVHLQPNDVVLTLGAGDVWKWGESLVRVLQSES